MSDNTLGPDVPANALVHSSADMVDMAVTNLRKISSEVPVELQQKLMAVMARALPNKKGMEEAPTAARLPTVRIKQPVTQSEACPETAKIGDLYTSLGQAIGKELVLTPIKFYERNDRFEAGGQKLSCSAPDAKLGNPLGWCVNPKTKEECPYLPMGKNSDGRKTDCTNSLVVVAVDREMTGIFEIQFSKTSRRAGSTLQRLAGAGTTAWDNWYKLTTEKQTGGQGVYFTYKIAPSGERVDADTSKICDALSDLVTAQRKNYLDGYYQRRQGAADTVQAMETIDAAALMGNTETGGGEEPSFDDSPKTEAKKGKKDYSKSM